MGRVSQSLFQYVFDASSLIDIERRRLMQHLRNRRDQIILPEQVAGEVKEPGSALERFLNHYPDVVTSFRPEEEDRYIEILQQPASGVHKEEAAAITLALTRRPIILVIEDNAGKRKAENHGITFISWKDFVRGG